MMPVVAVDQAHCRRSSGGGAGAKKIVAPKGSMAYGANKLALVPAIIYGHLMHHLSLVLGLSLLTEHNPRTRDCEITCVTSSARAVLYKQNSMCTITGGCKNCSELSYLDTWYQDNAHTRPRGIKQTYGYRMTSSATISAKELNNRYPHSHFGYDLPHHV